MARESKKNNPKVSATTPRPAAPLNQATEQKGLSGYKTHLLIVSGIAAITWLFLKNCLDNSISCWDDVPYLRENRYIKDLSWEGIRNIFSTPVMGNYHPLTILSYAIEYSIVELEPWLFHFDSLALHIATTLLVYWFTLLLTRRTAAAVVTALLFGLHPMHVESVAWVAARKDVLYAAFYMTACITYIFSLRTTGHKQKLLYLGTLALFICALLSKPVAVTLPLALLLIDYLGKGSLTKGMLISKIPHFILGFVFGIIAIKVQHTAGAMEMQRVDYTFIERLALGAYAFITYLWKAIIPAHLHCQYPYPQKINGWLPYNYFIYPVAVVVIAFVVWKYARRNKVVMFGILFFITNIALLLQFLAVGSAIIAERYSYLPYLGLFFIAGWFVSGCFEAGAKTQYRYAALILTACYTGWLGFRSAERCKVWYDDQTLWQDEIEQLPEEAGHAYLNLGYLYYGKWAMSNDPREKQVFYDSASYLMNKAISIDPDFVNPYVGLGEMERAAGNYDRAKKIYYSALDHNTSKGNIYVGLAILYVITNNYDSAGYYFKKEIEADNSAEAYGNYANLLEITGKDDSALAYYNKAVSLVKDNYSQHMNRGKLYKKLNRWSEARSDIQEAIKRNPDVGELYYIRSFCDTQAKNNTMALRDVEKAISLGYKNVDSAYYSLLRQTAVQ